MNKQEVCKNCLNARDCKIFDPVGINGKIPQIYIDCIHYTCSLEGERSAREAHRNGQFLEITLEEGSVTEGALWFGK